MNQNESKTPILDPHVCEFRDGFGYWSKWVPFDVAAALETENAALREALTKLRNAGDATPAIYGQYVANIARAALAARKP